MSPDVIKQITSAVYLIALTENWKRFPSQAIKIAGEAAKVRCTCVSILYADVPVQLIFVESYSSLFLASGFETTAIIAVSTSDRKSRT